MTQLPARDFRPALEALSRALAALDSPAMLIGGLAKSLTASTRARAWWRR